MPPRDEESRFEQVLARHLRREGAGAGAGCPDAETLAAYHERALTAEEMNAYKGHIAACGSCQEVLAGLEASEGVAARERDEWHVASSRSARAAAMPAARATRERPKRIWKWMAPAAAVAAGVLVWVAVRDTRHTPAEPTTVAVNKQPSGAGQPSPALREEVPARSADPRASTAGKQAPSGPPAAPPLTSLEGARKEVDSLSAQLSAGKDQKLDQKVPRRDENSKTEQYGYSGRAEDQIPTMMKQQTARSENAALENQKAPALPWAQVGMESGKKDAGQQVAMENAPANSREYRAGQVTPTERAKRAMQEGQEKQAPADKDTVAVTAAAAAEAKAVATANESKNEKLQRLAKTAAEPQTAFELRDRGAFFANGAGGLIVAPEKAVMWRVGPAGMILKTADGGLSWMRQASGVNVELLAGSAPSETVCWVVGRGGIILRTTDGEHWERIAPPAKSDLIGIDARDAQTAAVWSLEKLPKYVTRDGGKTWQRAGAGKQP